MEGLRTARVVVIDDKFEEALPFIQAVARQRIGILYYSGVKEEELPEEENQLTGIRLAALDMNLGHDENAEIPLMLSTILSVLDRLIDEKNGPYLAIAWTNRPEVVDEFKERARKLACPPIDVITMGKDTAKVGNEYNLGEVFSEIQKAINGCYPLRLLSYWEQQVHESSGSVMELIPGAEDWIARSRRTLALLLASSSGADDPSEAKLGALLSGFNSLQLDAIETSTGSLSEEEIAPLIEPLEVVNPDGDLDLKAILNRRLLFTRPIPNIAPGNIYDSSVFSQSEPVPLPTLQDLLLDMAQQGKAEELEQVSTLVAMEVTPLCDYQQHKMRVARFILGIALPTNRVGLLKRADFLRRLPVTTFEDEPLQGSFVIVWNSHYVITAVPSAIPDSSAFLRMRYAPLIDTQAWLGSQANRPGYLSV